MEVRTRRVDIDNERGHVADDVTEHAHPDDLDNNGVDNLEVTVMIGAIVSVSDRRDGGDTPVERTDVLVPERP